MRRNLSEVFPNEDWDLDTELERNMVFLSRQILSLLQQELNFRHELIDIAREDAPLEDIERVVGLTAVINGISELTEDDYRNTGFRKKLQSLIDREAKKMLGGGVPKTQDGHTLQ